MEGASLKEYIALLNDNSCLKIIYYLYKFNPNIPITELSKNLELDKNDVVTCLEKLTHSNVVLKTERGGYSLTAFGRTAFDQLLKK